MAGGGFGEAALLGAALGGGVSILKKEDPLKGALIGAATAGIGSGIKEGMQAAGILGGAETALPPLIEAGAPGAAELGSFAATPAGLDLASVSPMMNAVPAAGTLMPGESAGILGGLGNKAGNLMGSIGESWKELPADKKWLYGGLGALGGASMLSQMMAKSPEEEEINSRRWKSFRPTFYAAQGGMVPGYATGGGIANLYTSGYGPLDEVQDQQVPNQQELSTVPAAGYLGQSVKMMAHGGISSLGGYSDGGRLLKGPGDGMSDHIPATIGGRQPARLAEGEFVVPADVVSHLGNGSTDAGAKQLYAMMDRIRHARTGNKKQGRQINPRKLMVA